MKTPKQIDPENNLCALVVDVARLMRRDFARRMRDLNLTQSQWRTLISLRRFEGINQAPLADLLEIQPITLARLLDRMAEAGLIERRPDPKDRRAFCLYLTPKAKPVVDEMLVLGAETLEALTSGFSASEREQCMDLLKRMKRNLTEAEAEDGSSVPSKKTARA
jgi:MarR family transcriptional regulator for hemolysin